MDSLDEKPLGGNRGGGYNLDAIDESIIILNLFFQIY
jgi:hypothetical protein